MIEELRENINSILTLRDDLGAAKAPVYLVTRRWSGSEPGDGEYRDTEVPVLPSPAIQQYTDDIRIKEGGAIQQSDIKLRWVSRQSFPVKSEIDGTTDDQAVEKLYRVGDVYYTVIAVEERLLCWHVLLRRKSKQ